jgi:hypothetical protein
LYGFFRRQVKSIQMRAEEHFMTRWIGAVILGIALMVGGSAAIAPAAATQSRTTVQKPQAGKTTDLSARRRIRHPVRYAYPAYAQPHYEDRPDYYRPYPYVLPVPFFLGFGFGPW